MRTLKRGIKFLNFASIIAFVITGGDEIAAYVMLMFASMTLGIIIGETKQEE